VTLARGATDGPITIGIAVVATIVMLRTDWNQAILVLAAGAFGAFVLR
jgi:chromate transport protein ChrA